MYQSGFFHNAYKEGMEGARVGAQSGARDAERRANEAETRADRLALLCEAMWTLVAEKTGLTDEQSIDRINEIDLHDGKLDGKKIVDQGPLRCYECNRAVAARFAKCMYCGTPVARCPFE